MLERIRRVRDATNPINLISVYNRLGRSIGKRAWQEIFQNINTTEGIIISGDFNSHHGIWNCERTDNGGVQLLEAFEENDLFIVNSDTKSRIEGMVRETQT